jgi:hypothetical protein
MMFCLVIISRGAATDVRTYFELSCFPFQAKSAAARLEALGGSVGDKQRNLQAVVREELDLTWLGAVERYFSVDPPAGRIEPGETTTFTLTFVPTAVQHYVGWLQLLVDTAVEGTPGTKPDTLALEVSLTADAFISLSTSHRPSIFSTCPSVASDGWDFRHLFRSYCFRLFDTSANDGIPRTK